MHLLHVSKKDIFVQNAKMLKMFHCTLRKHNSWTAKIHRSQTQNWLPFWPLNHTAYQHQLLDVSQLGELFRQKKYTLGIVGNQETFTLPRKLTFSHLKMGRNPKGSILDRIPTIQFSGAKMLVSGGVGEPFCCREVGSLTDENKLIGWTFGSFSTTKTCER